MKVSYLAILGLSTVVLSACSFTPREQAEGDFEYTNVELREPLRPAAGKQLPTPSNRYEVPQVNVTGEVGKDVNVLSPVLVRATAAGSRPSENPDVTAVDFSELDGMENLPAFVWESLYDELAERNIEVRDEAAEQSLTTGWISENVLVTEDELEVTVERRFKVNMEVPDHRRIATLSVEMIDKKQSGPGAGMAPGGVSDSNAEAALLNGVINEIAIRQQEIFAEAEANAVVNVEPTFNADGMPAFQVDIGFDVAWPLTEEVLEALGFEVDDLNQSTGMYYVNYLREAGFSLAFWNSRSDGKIDLPDGNYQINVTGDNNTSTITIFRGEEPLTAADIDRIYGPFAAEIRRQSAL
ncbi:outer membrane protein assembly factor BamC [Pseudidiomarina salilacus]|uniref:outer membrane protein assembly factor BamC n=1 Tax=Pseudidiomarina salilacus TaxID=3384452 RepID=UPI003984AC9D